MVFNVVVPSGMCRLRLHVLALGGLSGGAIGARSWPRAGDHDIGVSDPWRSVSRESGKRVPQVGGIVALRAAIEALVRAARLAPGQRGVCDRLRDVELESQLEDRKPFGVPAACTILQRDALVAPLEDGKRVARVLHPVSEAVDAAAALDALRHLVAHGGEPLVAVSAQQRLERA